MSFRKEEKLKVHHGQLANLSTWIQDQGGEVLHESRIVSSTYFDTDDLRMYRDSEEGCVPRKKIRIRSYAVGPHEPGACSLETKISSVEGRYKIVTREFDLRKIMNFGVLDADYGICKPVVRVTYRRIYYRILDIRLTLDRNIEYASAGIGGASVYRVRDPDIAVELKAAEAVTPEFLNFNFPFDRVRFSKYSRAISCMLANSAKAV